MTQNDILGTFESVTGTGVLYYQSKLGPHRPYRDHTSKKDVAFIRWTCVCKYLGIVPIRR